MRFATRMNSFLTTGESLQQVIQNLAAIEGITDVELNYPEHFRFHTTTELKHLITEAGFAFSGVAVRVRKDF